MKQKKFFKLAAITTLAVGMMALTPMTADAAKAPKKTTISPNVSYTYSSDISNEGAIRVEFDEPGDYIKNIKVKNKNLIAQETGGYCYYSKYFSEYYESEYGGDSNYSTIGLYAKKNLTTTLTFDIYGIDNKKKETKTVKVTTKVTSSSSSSTPSYGYPIKSISYAGKPLLYGQFSTKSSGKVKVKMNKNYKLVSIEVGTYGKPVKSSEGNTTYLKNEVKYKKVKNNGKISLGKKAYYYESIYASTDGNYTSHYFYDYLIAPTEIRITYKNTKTKDTGVLTYRINTFAK